MWADCTTVTGDPDRRRALRERARAWWTVDPDPETRAALEAMLRDDDARALDDAFARPLVFGTAGLRGAMGPGPSRMNRVVVRRATAGLMSQLPVGARVVIGHDARKNSAEFALDAARVVAAHGGNALVLAPHAPTPLVAFAVRHLAADAGVVCTASHNPPQDNGYKVYLADGAQVVAPIDARIAAAIDGIDTDVGVAPIDDPAIHRLDHAIERDYLEHVIGLETSKPTEGGHVRIVYSALHGVGAALTTVALERSGFEDVRAVEAQREPDAAFPTIVSPNPEDLQTLVLARDQAERANADVAFVHDPDADRLAVLVPGSSGWRALSGNEIGLLLADHVLGRTSGTDRLVVDTVVSSSALAALAEAHEVHHARTLTGFKWIVRPAIERPELRFVFGYEEALGYSVDAYVRDKDGISAAVAFAALVSELRARHCTVDDRLRELAVAHGLFTTAAWTRTGPSRDSLAIVMARLRQTLPEAVGAFAVESVEDFADGGDLPPTDLLVLRLRPDSRLAIRPSGTEPKLKFYAEVIDAVPDEAVFDRVRATAVARLDALRDATEPWLEGLTIDA